MQVIRFHEREGAGHIIDIEPRDKRLEFRPMDQEAFRRFYIGDGILDFALRNTKVAIKGPEHNDDNLFADVSFSLERKGSSIEYAALVPGGWLPANIAQVDVFLPDSNIACNLGEFKRALEPASLRLCDALDMGARQINPMLPAIEGSMGRFPSLEEIDIRAREVYTKIERRFPGRALRLSAAQVLGAYGLIEELKPRWPRERAFLQAIWPLFAKLRSKEADLPLALAKVFEERSLHRIPKLSFLNLLVIDALFAPKNAPKHWCAGAAVLKPHLPPTDANLYNACSDVWILELAMKSNAIFGEYSTAVCTLDRGLIGAWALLSPREFTNRKSTAMTQTLGCKVSLRDALAERLSAELRTELWRELERA